MKDKDEQLAHQLGEALQDAHYLDDPRWTRLAESRLGADQLAELRAEMRKQGMSPEKIDLAEQALQPLDGSFLNKMASLVEQTNVEPATGPDQLDRHRRSNRATSDRIWLQRWFWRLAPALAASVMILWVMWPTTIQLPAYQLEFIGGETAIRSTQVQRAATIPSLTPQSLFELFLRPTTRVSQPESLTLVAFLKSGDQIQPIQLDFNVVSNGTVVVKGQVGSQLTDQPGAYELILVVLPKSQEDLLLSRNRFESLDSMRHPTWRVFAQPISITTDK